MDAYIKYTQDKVVEDQDIHLVGIACMFIASKYEDIYHIPLVDFVERIAHNKFKQYFQLLSYLFIILIKVIKYFVYIFEIHREEIKQKEYEVLRAVKFKLSQPTALKLLYRFIFKSFKNEK